MGKRGPAPTPRAILTRRGSWRGKAAAGEPSPPAERPACPAWLSLDATRLWRELVPRLLAMGVLAKVDRNALARYCSTWARWRRAEEFLAAHGEVYPVRDRHGRVTDYRTYPEVKIAAQLGEALGRIEGQFGLTPSARRALGQTEQAQPAPTGMDRFFNTG